MVVIIMTYLYTLHIAKLTENKLSSSENVMYDAVGGAIKTSTIEEMTCSRNIAYATIKDASEVDLKTTPTGKMAVYDEVSPTSTNI